MYQGTNSLTFLSPLTAAYWKSAVGEVKKVRMLVLAAFFVALNIIVSGLYIQVGENLRILFSFFFAALGGAIYGPVLALISGFCSDILGYMLHPSGPFFLGYTLSTMLGALVYALLLYRARISGLRLFLSKLIVNAGVNVALGSLWSAMLYGKGYYYYLAKSVVKNLLVLPVETVLLFAFFAALLPVTCRMGLTPQQQGVKLW